MPIVIGSGLVLGWFFPGLVAWKPIIPPLFGYMTLVTALGISWRGVGAVAFMPGPVLWSLGLLHIAMPLFALALGGVVLGSSSPFTIGLVLAAVIPPAVTSVIWTGLAKGDLAVALTVVALDSLLSPMLIPGSIRLFLGHAVAIDTGDLMRGLLWMVVLPTMAGVTLHDLTGGRIGPAAAPFNGPCSKIGLTLVVAINLAAAHDTVLELGGSAWPVLILLLLQANLAFLLGGGMGRMLGYGIERVKAMTFSVGLRNLSAGAVIALQYFPPAVSLPVILCFTLQQPLAALYCHFLTARAGSRLASAECGRR